MLEFTAPDGSPVTVDPNDVIRARQTLSHEAPGRGTRIDWGAMQLVTEPIDDVGPRIKEVLASFTHLTTRGGADVWFNAMKVKGPAPLTPQQADGTVRSAIILMNYRQYVIESPEQVRQVIEAAGGTPIG